MNKFKYLSIAALLLTISACTPSQEAKLEASSSQANAADTTNIEPVSKAVSGKVNRPLAEFILCYDTKFCFNASDKR